MLRQVLWTGVLFLALPAAGEWARVSGPIGISGKGCSAKTASVTVSPDATAVSVLFDRYASELEPGKRHVGYKRCKVVIPVRVSPGYRLKVRSADYRGYAFLASRRNTLQFFSNLVVKNGCRYSVSPVRHRFFRGPADEEFIFSKVGRYQPRGCASDYTLSFASWFVLTGTAIDPSNSLFSIDSFDFSLDSDQVELEPCSR